MRQQRHAHERASANLAPFGDVAPEDRATTPDGERCALVHERRLRCIGVNPRQTADAAVGLDHVEEAPVGQGHDRAPRDLRQRRLVVERRREHDTRLRDERAPLFRSPCLGHVAEDQDGAADSPATGAPDGRAAVGDAVHAALEVDESRLVGKPNRDALAKRSPDRVLHGAPRLPADGSEDLDDGTTDRPVAGARRESLRFGVDEGHDALGVRRDDGVPDALQRGREALLALLRAPHVAHALEARGQDFRDRGDELALGRREPDGSFVDEVQRAQHAVPRHERHRRDPGEALPRQLFANVGCGAGIVAHVVARDELAPAHGDAGQAAAERKVPCRSHRGLAETARSDEDESLGGLVQIEDGDAGEVRESRDRIDGPGRHLAGVAHGEQGVAVISRIVRRAFA